MHHDLVGTQKYARGVGSGTRSLNVVCNMIEGFRNHVPYSEFVELQDKLLQVSKHVVETADVYTLVTDLKYKVTFLILNASMVDRRCFTLPYHVLRCMNVYKTRRLAESIRQLDRSCIDHYDITQEDRDMQEARALGEIKSDVHTFRIPYRVASHDTFRRIVCRLVTHVHDIRRYTVGETYYHPKA